ncbi:tRNA-guanine transglycosylase [Diaporthe amygdali]|uniref:tRNA-guanine transglycosylase n=1 Tax=Phomopsis amygdali TaxID=1214568 RepID=UPI0022FF3D51|nr:tRNA-guanine transglycosylase [Diaporthe amygdali]KAJ0117031.1 tRNA-guanine transglycosylase [Diaporthe amygdali]
MSEPSRIEEGMRFETLKTAGAEGLAARLGRLVLPQRQAVDTPNYFAVASRGVVPHLTPDTIARHGGLSGAYMAMEDMVEKSQKKITKIPAVQRVPTADGKRLHAFTALPSSSITILGPRRVPPVKAPIGNSDNYIQIFTSNGFQALRNPDYINAIETLKPDIAIPLADINYGQETTPQAKSIRRMCERTEEWMSELHASVDLDNLRSSNTSIFAPTLPAPYPMQWEYLNHLSEDIVDILSGLAIYDVDILPDLVNYPALTPLARLSVDSPSSPHDVLRQISLGIDTFILPFINATSDAGVAMTFTFTAPTGSESNAGGIDLLPLATDLTASENQTSLEPLTGSCTCYACTHHHRAYLHHLLNAREMLAWTLLQIHNHHTITEFFAAVRASIASGSFEDDRRAFQRAYEADFPAGMGTRPRARGYHFKSEGGDEKRNKPVWGRLNGEEEKEKKVVVTEKLRANEMETPLVPGADADAADLWSGRVLLR